MRKIILFVLVIVVVLLSESMVHGKKLGILTEVLKPEGIEVSGGRLYVVEDSTFFVYSLRDLDLIAKFGKKGQGPGELGKALSFPNAITVLHDKILVEGFNKVIFYSKDFNYLKEIRKKGFMMYKVTPVGKNFAAVRMSGEKKKIILTLLLLDPGMNVIKELHRQETIDRQEELVMHRDTIHFAVYQDKVFVEESNKGFVIEVFDSTGTRLFEINKDISAAKVTGKEKKAMFDDLKGDRMMNLVAQRKGGWEKFEKTGTFTYPDSFPPIQDIIVIDDKIYVSTYHRKNNTGKYMIMDLQGKVIRTSYLPIPPKKSGFFARSLGKENRFYGIANNQFYYLVENEDDEEWEVHAVEIK